MATVHVMPSEDLVEHDGDGDDCICGVTVEYLINQYGQAGKLILHHSLDGREFADCEE
jgi:hypothetical protein